MAGLFTTIEMASRALQVTQNQVRTRSHNIANASTPGFSRQRVETAASPSETIGAGEIGTGVEQRHVIRITDRFLQRQLVDQEASLGSTARQADIMSQVETILDEQTIPGVSAGLSELYSAFADITSSLDPGAPLERENLRNTAQKLVDTLHRLDGELRTLQQTINTELRNAVEEVTVLAARVAQLNSQIIGTEETGPANDLRDERDRLVRQISSYVDIDTIDQDNGAQDVYISGSFSLVSGGTAVALGVEVDPTNPFAPDFLNVTLDPGGINFNLSNRLRSGEIAGLLNGRDVLAGDAIRALDTVAFNLAASVNAVHQTGFGLDGVTGRDFFTAPVALNDAARDLQLDVSILTSTNAIGAAASAAELPAGNDVIQALADLRENPIAMVLPGPVAGPNTALLDYSASILTRVGLDSATLKGAEEQQRQVLDVLLTRRDEISGVDLDEEVANLLQLERLFQANSRIIQTVDELLRNVISLL